MTNDTIIGVDLAKSVFQLHGASMTGQPKFRKKLSRQGFAEFMSKQPPAIVFMEAFGSAHYWAREISSLGHEVKLIAPQYVKPFVKRQKNDAADAEAIVIAAQRPEMRFVELKQRAAKPRHPVSRSRAAGPPTYGTGERAPGVPVRIWPYRSAGDSSARQDQRHPR